METTNKLEVIAQDVLRHLPKTAVQSRVRASREHAIAALLLVGLSVGTVWLQLRPLRLADPGAPTIILWSVVAVGAVASAVLQQFRTTKRADDNGVARISYAQQIVELETVLLRNASESVGADWHNPQDAFARLSARLQPVGGTRIEQASAIPDRIRIPVYAGPLAEEG